MATSQSAPAEVSPELVAERYRVEKLLGRGGMAAVYQVYDTAKNRVVALKRLIHDESLDGYAARLFEREYHTLSQLVHPRIIEVYDYHTDARGPFYTMELLTGGDLRQRSPIAWRQACRILCEVCSALALLHSRRFAHRDLTPLNIRCTVDERAKLFDFGSMTQFGRSKHVVGTPPFIAPEALHGQVIDGATDLYALGATAYYALTGRHAYPARVLCELPDLWKAPPLPPSAFVPGLPPALDELIMSLLSPRPADRPPSAAEVMERLSAIGGFELHEALMVGASYLSTPTLVGRDDHLASFARQLQRAAERRGTSILVSGAGGSGRTRLLDACALDAKLSGSLVLRADARDSAGQRWGAARALIEQLLEQLPELSGSLIAKHALRLAPIMPDLAERFRPGVSQAPPAQPGPAGQPARAELQAALRDLLLEVAKQRTLALIIDDLDRIDEPSAALLALLAHRSRQHRLLLLGSIDSDAKGRDSRPLQLLRSVSDAMRLRGLDSEQTQELVISLFGDVANVRWVSDRIFSVTRGSPRLVMRVAQHLVDSGACHYAAGTWTLPSTLETDALTGGLRETIDPSLPESALDFARVLAASELERVPLEECLELYGSRDPKQLQADLYLLAAEGILAVDDESVGFSRPGWERRLLEDLTPDQRRGLHARVAKLFEQRIARSGASGTVENFRHIQHLLRSGELERALVMLRDDVENFRDQRLRDPVALYEYLQTLPKKWPETFHLLIEACRNLKRPLLDRLALQAGLVGFAAMTGRLEREMLVELVGQLRYDCGLDLIEAYRGQVPESELLVKALGAAQQRYDATPEHDRGFPLLPALHYLGQLITQAIGMAARTLDVDLLESMPSLVPLQALSPALAIVHENVVSSLDTMAARTLRARQRMLEITKRLEAPDRAGLDESHHTAMSLAVQWATGTVEAHVGRPSACGRADAIAESPLFAVSALRLRAIYALFRGDRASAEYYRAQTELFLIQNSPPQVFEGAQALQWTFGYAAIGDLLRVKQCLVDVEALAREHPGWKPVLHTGRGAYQALRGDHARALSEFEHALSLMPVGRHPAWPFCAGSLIWTLVRQERLDAALARGHDFLASMEAEQMDGAYYAVLTPVAYVECRLGRHDAALAHIESAIDFLAADGGESLHLGAAYEVRAYIALGMRDAAAFQQNAAKCEAQYKIGGQPSLIARHEKLLRAARKLGLSVAGPKSADVEAPVAANDVMTTVSTVLSTAQGSEERAERALAMLAKFSRCKAGSLYIMQRQGPVLVAQLGSVSPVLEMDSLVAKYLLDAIEQREVTQTDEHTTPEPRQVWTPTEGAGFTPMLLSHPGERGMSITGVAVMSLPKRGNVRVPTRLLQALSKALYEAGDAITQLTHELEADLPPD